MPKAPVEGRLVLPGYTQAFQCEYNRRREPQRATILDTFLMWTSSSMAEHALDKRGAAGSSPARSTTNHAKAWDALDRFDYVG